MTIILLFSSFLSLSLSLSLSHGFFSQNKGKETKLLLLLSFSQVNAQEHGLQSKFTSIAKHWLNQQNQTTE